MPRLMNLTFGSIALPPAMRVAAATLIAGGNAIEPNVKFINLGMRASAQNESVELKRWGLSGMAPFCF